MVSDSQEEAVRAFALGLPGAWEDPLPGRSSIKVGNKAFAFLGAPVGGMGVKLPESGGVLLTMSFARPYGYGLGKSGWVEIALGAGDGASADLLLKCVAESYRAVAPKSLVAQMDAGGKTETSHGGPTSVMPLLEGQFSRGRIFGSPTSAMPILSGVIFTTPTSRKLISPMLTFGTLILKTPPLNLAGFPKRVTCPTLNHGRRPSSPQSIVFLRLASIVLTLPALEISSKRFKQSKLLTISTLL